MTVAKKLSRMILKRKSVKQDNLSWLSMEFSDSAVRILKKLYSFQALLYNDNEKLSTYLENRTKQQESPVVLFDPIYYLQQLSLAEQLVADQIGVFRHWLKFGVPNLITPLPSTFFEPEFYLENNEDVAENGIWPFEHFVLFGAEEFRMPSSFFCGIEETHTYKTLEKTSNWYDLFTISSSYIDVFLVEYPYKKLEKIYFNNDTKASDINSEINVKDIVGKGEALNSLFEKEFYTQELIQQFPWLSSKASFISWLILGELFKLKFTPLFDQNYYEHSYATLANAQTWTFVHYVFHGFLENRSPNPFFKADLYKNRVSCHSPAIIDYLEKVSCGNDVLHEVLDSLNKYNNYFQNVLESSASSLHAIVAINKKEIDRINSVKMQQLFSKVEEVCPNITNSIACRAVTIPGLIHPNNKQFLISKNIKRLIVDTYGYESIENIILIPHSRMSGAARVSRAVVASLLRTRPNENLLVLTTDSAEVNHSDWRQSVNILDISQLLSGVSLDQKQYLLVDIIRGLTAKRVINVNSFLGWTTFEAYGKQLSSFCQIYAYMFCWDRNISNKRVGYPSTFFDSTYYSLTKLFVDSKYQRKELCQTYGINEELGSKIVTLPTPLESKDVDNISSKKLNSELTSIKKYVFWAGRFDRQKRFDLLLKIAVALPEIEFWVWGKPVLGDCDYHRREAPKNIVFKGTYQHFSEIPLVLCDVWLYTSAWDGVPTILLDVASKGIPIVASSVEGVTDIIDESTAWPVYDIDDTEEYIENIKLALTDVPQSVEKSVKLSQYIAENHVASKYDKLLLKALSDE